MGCTSARFAVVAIAHDSFADLSGIPGGCYRPPRTVALQPINVSAFWFTSVCALRSTDRCEPYLNGRAGFLSGHPAKKSIYPLPEDRTTVFSAIRSLSFAQPRNPFAARFAAIVERWPVNAIATLKALPRSPEVIFLVRFLSAFSWRAKYANTDASFAEIIVITCILPRE